MQGVADDVTAFQRMRTSIPATREQIVRLTNLSLGTVRNVENGEPVREATAIQLWRALNRLLSDAGLPTVAMENLGFRIRVDKRAPSQESQAATH